MTKRRVYGCLLALVLCFIFGNSMLSKETSRAISQFVADLIGVEAGEPGGDEGHFLIRKLAHIIEYAALGVISHLFFDSLTRDKYKKYVTLSLVGVAVPLVDETIQIFSARGPALSDVWIDVGGYIVGVLAVCGAFLLARRAFEAKEKA